MTPSSARVLDRLPREEPCFGVFFSSYSFDPSFFESQVLRAVLWLTSDPVEQAKRYHDEARHALQETPVAVVVDAGERQAGRRLPYDLPDVDEVVFHPNGRDLLLRSEGTTPGTRKLLTWTRGVDSLPRVLVESPFDHYAPALSPDGRWVAYVSEESGDPEVYVRPYPAADSARIAVSISGGVEPRWSPNGRELFYRDRRGAMFAVAVETTPTFRAGAPELLFYDPGLLLGPYYRAYDVAQDGQRFLMLTSGDEASSTLNLVLNWRRELDERDARGAGR